MPEYEEWKESLGGGTRGWDIKYYKVRGEGPGTDPPRLQCGDEAAGREA
jgi:hypothetical protein